MTVGGEGMDWVDGLDRVDKEAERRGKASVIYLTRVNFPVATVSPAIRRMM